MILVYPPSPTPNICKSLFPISPGYYNRPKILGGKQGALWFMWKWWMGSVFKSFHLTGLIWVSFSTAVILVPERIIQLSNQESKEKEKTSVQYLWLVESQSFFKLLIKWFSIPLTCSTDLKAWWKYTWNTVSAKVFVAWNGRFWAGLRARALARCRIVLWDSFGG